MSKTVLIVDDHPSFRGMARALLESEGFTVVGEAEDGAAAIAQARALHPDLILLDVQLPDMDGFAVAAQLTSNGSRPDTVAASGRHARALRTLVQGAAARPAPRHRAHLEPRRTRLRDAGRGVRRPRLRPQGRDLGGGDRSADRM